MQAGIALGSNLGDRLAHLQRGRDQLTAGDTITLVAQSSVYETEPVDCPPDATAFLNAVILVETTVPPEELLMLAHSIETEAGRERQGVPNAPRPLDLDLLFQGNEVRTHLELTLPHPRLHQRRFVLQPLAELAPDLLLPGLDASVETLLTRLSRSPEAAPQLVCQQW